MSTDQATAAPIHALLIGIDAYNTDALSGCVNDIDLVQRLLLSERVKLPVASITRLASPLPGAQHDERVPSRPATLDNIRAALAALASDAVKADHRVFIYYSGHGSQVALTNPEDQRIHREVLVPVDCDAEPSTWRVLYDLELNQLLAQIAKRTTSVTMIMDACHSAGATRGLAAGNAKARSFDLSRDQTRKPALPRGFDDLAGPGLRGAVNEVLVVAGCLNHESSMETTDANGGRNGVLTRALISALNGCDVPDLNAVPWALVWQQVRAQVEAGCASQHPWISGGLWRAVLGSPPVEGDAGFAVRRKGDEYHIDAGELAGITENARLAVYGHLPAFFPSLDSNADLEARVSPTLLKVRGEPGPANAVAVAEGAPFELPAGARARLVKPGAIEQLGVAVVPPDDAIIKALGASPLLRLVEPAKASVKLLQDPGSGRWSIVDELFGVPNNPEPLYTLGNPTEARASLEHYWRYSAPVRMVSRCQDLSAALKIELLSCPHALKPHEVDKVLLKEANRGSVYPYELTHGANVCIRVTNRASSRLKVTLLDVALSGCVHLLGEQTIAPNSSLVFWSGEELGSPFTLELPDGRDSGIDRLIAIGTTDLNASLAHLGLGDGFGEAPKAANRGGADDAAAKARDLKKTQKTITTLPLWTADGTLIMTRRA